MQQEKKKVVGNYELVSRLGKGAYGDVYKMQHVTTGVFYAMKAISREQLGDQRGQENLDSEIAIMRDYVHPNIVRLIDRMVSPKNIYLIVELCSGGDLAKFIKLRGRLDERVAHSFLRQLSDGLYFLHTKNVVHRDLKPANVLLTENSEYATIKLADFGFARHLAESALARTQCGTPLYMAPEVFENQAYDSKVDLWSVGCIFHEMLTGKPPFKGSNPGELFQNIKRSSLVLPSDVRVSEESCIILRRLLEKDPLRRASLQKFYDGCRLLKLLVREPTPPSDASSDIVVDVSSQSTLSASAALPPPPPPSPPQTPSRTADRPSSVNPATATTIVTIANSSSSASSGSTDLKIAVPTNASHSGGVDSGGAPLTPHYNLSRSQNTTNSDAPSTGRPFPNIVSPSSSIKGSHTVSSDDYPSPSDSSHQSRYAADGQAGIAIATEGVAEQRGGGLGIVASARVVSGGLHNQLQSQARAADSPSSSSNHSPFSSQPTAHLHSQQMVRQQSNELEAIVSLETSTCNHVCALTTAMIELADGFVRQGFESKSSKSVRHRRGSKSHVDFGSSSEHYVQDHFLSHLSNACGIYLHSLTILQEAIKHLHRLIYDHDSLGFDQKLVLTKLKQRQMLFFDELVCRVEQCYQRLSLGGEDYAVAVAAEPILYTTALSQAKEASVAEMLGNLSRAKELYSSAMMFVEAVSITASDSSDKVVLRNLSAAYRERRDNCDHLDVELSQPREIFEDQFSRSAASTTTGKKSSWQPRDASAATSFPVQRRLTGR